MLKPQKVTLEDVAKDAGVGKGTVDRVIHNRGYVSEEARRKVEQSIKKLGYQLNPVASLLARDRFFRVIVIFHNTQHEFWDDVERGIDRAASIYETKGVRVDKNILLQMDPISEAAAIYGAVADGYDGIALVPYHSKEVREAMNRATDAGVKIVEFNNYESRDFAYVGEDMLQSGRLAGRLMSLIAPRNARYAVIIPGRDIMQALDDRLKGFMEIIGAERKDMELAGLIDSGMNLDTAAEKIKELLTSDRIDALYATNLIAEAAAEVLSERKKDTDIRFICHDLTAKTASFLQERVIDMVIDQEAEQQGYYAVSVLAEALTGGGKLKGHATGLRVLVAENMCTKLK